MLLGGVDSGCDPFAMVSVLAATGAEALASLCVLSAIIPNRLPSKLSNEKEQLEYVKGKKVERTEATLKRRGG